MRRALRESTLVHLPGGEWALVHAGKAVWRSAPIIGFGDDGDLDLSSLSDAASSASSGASDAASSLSSAVSGLSSTASDAASSLSGAVSGVASQAGGIASSAEGALGGIAAQAQGAVGQAESAVSQGAAALSNASNMTPGQALSAGENLLTTVTGADSAAGGVVSAIQSGDWKGAGAQALKAAQAAAAGSSSSALQMGAKGAAEASSVGAAVGTVFPVVGNIVGAIVGAIYGFLDGVGEYIMGNALPAGNIVANKLTFSLVHAWRGGENFSGFLDSKDASLAKAWFSKSKQAGQTVTETDANKNNYSVTYKQSDSVRDAFWRNFPVGYVIMGGTGPQAKLALVGHTGVPDTQASLDAWLQGNYPGMAQTPTTRPGVDFALWLATQTDGMKMLAASPPSLQAGILPFMPMAVATALYLAYVPVLASPGCYSPAAIDAVRKAASAAAAKAGPQIAQSLALSLPADDLTLLLYAYGFVCQNSPLYYMVERVGMWAPDGPVVSGLLAAIGQCAIAKAKGNLNQALALVAQAVTSESKLTPILPGESLAPGDSRTSPNGKYKLILQTDGNLVIYAGTAVHWATNTAGKSPSVLTMQTDGNLVLYDHDKRAYWATNTNWGAGNVGSYAALQDDGNLVIYSNELYALWDAKASDHSEDRGVPVNPGERDKLDAAVLAASKKPVVIDCLKGLAAPALDQKIGLTAALGGLPPAAKAASRQRHAAHAKVAAAKAVSTSLARGQVAPSVKKSQIVVAAGAGVGAGLLLWLIKTSALSGRHKF